MSEARQVLTPGDPAATATAAAPAPTKSAKGGRAASAPAATPESAVAAGTGSDGDDGLDTDFDTDTLPPPAAVAAAAEQFTPAQQALIAKMIGDAVQASKAAQDPRTAARLAAEKVDPSKLPTQEAARAAAEDAVSRGIRPRAVLTTDGWYTHPETTRTPASLNGQAIAAIQAEKA